MIGAYLLFLYIVSAIISIFYVDEYEKMVMFICAIAPFIIGHYATYKRLYFYTILPLPHFFSFLLCALSSSKNKDAAWEVIKYFQSEEFLKGYLEGGYTMPISSYMDGIIDKTKLGRMADFSLLDYESVYPTVPSINLTGDNYRTVLWNAIMGHVDIDAAIEDLNTVR